MTVLTAKELDVLSEQLSNLRSVTEQSIEDLKVVCTRLMFNGCKSITIQKFASSNKSTRKGNRLYGMMRLVCLDQKLTKGGIRQMLPLIIYE